MKAGEFAAHTSAQCLGPKAAHFDAIAFDSRRMYAARPSLFIALKTAHGDGHRYIGQAIERGATAVLASHWPEEIPQPAHVAFLQHPHPLEALKNWARHQRHTLSGPLLALTGSNGKTIVKEWLYQLLGSPATVHRTPGSFNSELGVPLTLSALRPEHRAALVEVGIDRPGTMAELAQLVEPDYGIFTTLGAAHGENFASEDQKFAEKWRLFDGCSRIATSRKYWEKAQKMGLNCPPALLWGAGEEVDPKDFPELPFSGGPQLENAMSAIAGALLLGESTEAIRSRLAGLKSLGMRMQLLRAKDGGFLLEDTYSSDIESLRYALEELKTQSPTRRQWAVLSTLQTPEWTAEAKSLVEQMGIERCWWVHHPEEVADLVEAFAGMNLRDTTVLVKGRRMFALEQLAATLREQYHSTWVDVDLDAMRKNLKKFQQLLQPTTRTMAMVKAASYGTGTLEVAQWLEQLHIDYLGVAFAQEALNLRAHGIRTPILVMNAEPDQFSLLAAAGCDIELYRLSQLDPWLAQPTDAPLRVHLKIDTGMHRLGFRPEELDAVIAFLSQHPGIEVHGAFTHLACADDPKEDDFTRGQLRTFDHLVDRLRATFPGLLAHALNTHGLVRFSESQHDMVRLGIGLYGVGSYEGIGALDPVVSWACRVSQVGTLAPGESLGYGRSFIAERPTKYATLPVGYADGLSRSLSNGRGQVYIKEQPCPILGRVCMDMVMVDVTEVSDVKAMDIAVLLGPEQRAEEWAARQGTIGYEVLTGIGQRVPRFYNKG